MILTNENLVIREVCHSRSPSYLHKRMVLLDGRGHKSFIIVRPD